MWGEFPLWQSSKDPNAVAQVTVEARFDPQWVKDLVLPWLWHRSQLWLGFSLAWELPYAVAVATKPLPQNQKKKTPEECV